MLVGSGLGLLTALLLFNLTFGRFEAIGVVFQVKGLAVL
jgi:hypothetical protein